jgi:hypothetical protein
MSASSHSAQHAAAIWLFDCHEERRQRISQWLESAFVGRRVEARDEVPSGSDGLRFWSSLPSSWYVWLHVSNGRSLPFAEALRDHLTAGCLLVLFSGGGEENFDEFTDLRDTARIEFACHVGMDWLQPLVPILHRLRQSAERPVVSTEPDERLKRAPDGGSLVDDAGFGLPEAIRAFEVDRAHVSHDVFTNGFCSPLGFHCTDADSPRRRDPLVWARSDRKWWAVLQGPSVGWTRTRREVEEIFGKAESLGIVAGAGLAEVIDEARRAMTAIDTVMAKFGGPVFERTALTDEEIDGFWRSTDAVRRALQVIRVTDRGLASENFR